MKKLLRKPILKRRKKIDRAVNIASSDIGLLTVDYSVSARFTAFEDKLPDLAKRLFTACHADEYNGDALIALIGGEAESALKELELQEIEHDPVIHHIFVRQNAQKLVYEQELAAIEQALNEKEAEG